MKIAIIKAFVLLMITAGLISCKGSGKVQNSGSKQQKNTGTAFAAAPPVIIYKTTADYSNNVPVILNEDKTAIVSYPAPSDLYYRGNLALPLQLSDGFLLDQRGIDRNTAFLDITYKEYSRLDKAPPPDKLMEHIINKDPFLIIYWCGNKNQYDNLQAQLNRMIEAGDMGRCEQIDK